jgi:hypothetical protein
MRPLPPTFVSLADAVARVIAKIPALDLAPDPPADNALRDGPGASGGIEHDAAAVDGGRDRGVDQALGRRRERRRDRLGDGPHGEQRREGRHGPGTAPKDSREVVGE